MNVADTVRAQLAELARDVGRLRALQADPAASYQALLVQRIAERVELLDSLVHFTAADMVRQLVREGVVEDAAVAHALRVVDDHVVALHSTLRSNR